MNEDLVRSGNNTGQSFFHHTQAPTIYPKGMSYTSEGVPNPINHTMPTIPNLNNTKNEDLVLRGVNKSTTPETIKMYANQQGIPILSCQLLTKWEKANFNTFKISVNKQHAEKALSNSVWPIGISISSFQQKHQTQRQALNAGASLPNRGVQNGNGNRYQSLYIPEVGSFN